MRIEGIDGSRRVLRRCRIGTMDETVLVDIFFIMRTGTIVVVVSMGTGAIV